MSCLRAAASNHNSSPNPTPAPTGLLTRLPARLAWQDHTTNLFNGVHWEPPQAEQYVFKHQRPAKPDNLKIYEAHVGMASSEPKVATYADFARDVLPRVKRMGDRPMGTDGGIGAIVVLGR